MVPVRSSAATGQTLIGLDLGGTKMLGVLMDERATVQLRVRRPTPSGGEVPVCDAVLDLLAELIAAGKRAGRPIAGIAIGSPGYIDSEAGVILDATNLSVRNLPLGALVAQRFGLPAVIIQDVKAAALGEMRFGAATGARYTAFVNAGTGIAVGLIMDGQLYQGAANRAGEIGHVVMRPRGPLCNCGQRGCLEALASGPAIARQARSAAAWQRPNALLELANGARDQISAEIVAEAARQGDRLALRIIGAAAHYMGLAIAGLINVLDLQCVIVGGGLTQMGDLLLDPIRSTVYRYVLAEYRDAVPILPSGLGIDAGAIGAATALMADREI
jgi:glucokinase